jgi:hypothetical protein
MSTPPTAREFPIDCSGNEVRLLLAGKKTQFRRICHSYVCEDRDGNVMGYTGLARTRLLGTPEQEAQRKRDAVQGLLDACPWGAPGDRLWVREAVTIGPPFTDVLPNTRHIMYPAGGAQLEGVRVTPPCLMPRWASRITLELVSRRVERVQTITWLDAEDEGIEERDGQYVGADVPDGDPPRLFDSPVAAFADRWKAADGRRDRWRANVWVWRLEVKVVPLVWHLHRLSPYSEVP